MTIEVEYYLSCDVCNELYDAKYEDPQEVEDEAISDGWKVVKEGEHICTDCNTIKGE